jgi:hypothetical protein
MANNNPHKRNQRERVFLVAWPWGQQEDQSLWLLLRLLLLLRHPAIPDGVLGPWLFLEVKSSPQTMTSRHTMMNKVQTEVLKLEIGK